MTEQPEAPAVLTPQQIETLAEFADTVHAARSIGKIVAWGAGIATGVAAFLYYVLSIAAAWRPGHAIPPGGAH